MICFCSPAAIFASASEEEMLQDIDNIRNDAHQVCWRIVANNAIVKADPNGKHAWITNTDKYWKSIVEVIGKAIGDCVTGKNEFANPTKDGLIVFEASPERYERRHWNAVFLYNYINASFGLLYNKTDAESILDAIYNKVIMYYKNGYNIDNKMVHTMQDAKNDIIQYDKALGLGKILGECRQEDLKYKSARNVEDKILHLVPGIKIVKLQDDKENYNFCEIITHSEPYPDFYDVYFWFNPHTKKLNYSSIKDIPLCTCTKWTAIPTKKSRRTANMF